jgi:hypothetical protein
MTTRIARKFAASIILDGPATAKDIAHLISMLAPAAADTRDGFRDEILGMVRDVPVLGVDSRVGDLCRDAGVPRPAALLPLQGRLQMTGVDYVYRPEDKRQWNRPFRMMRGERPGALGPDDVVTCQLDTLLIALAHVESDPGGAVEVDLAKLREFGTRYSAMLYLRALAWMPGGRIALKGTWTHKRTPDGTVVTIPMEDVADALGWVGFDQPSRMDDRILKPAIADLRRVGIAMEYSWTPVPGYVRLHSHLTLIFRPAQAHEAGIPVRRRGRPPKAVRQAA